MALHPLLLAAAVGIAAVASPPADAQSRGYVSVTIGSPAPYYYGQRHRPGQVWVQGHWVHGHRGRVWVPGQYVRVHGYNDRRGRGYDPRFDQRYGYGHDYGYEGQVIYRTGSGQRVVPRSYYPPGYLSPRDDRRYRGW